MELNNKLTDKRSRLRKAAQDYQSTLSWYQENLDSPNAEQDCYEATAAFKREIAYRETDIIADLLDEIDELQERRKAEAVPVALRWRWDDSEAQWTYAIASKMPEFVAAGFTQNNGVKIEYLYTAPPAPVVPEELKYEDVEYPHTFNPGTQYAYQQGWNDCRAAMLKGGAK